MKKSFLNFSAIIIVLVTAFLNVQAQTKEIQSKSKSLPDGVTKEWLNSIQDENGNRIPTDPENSGDAFQTRNFSGYNAGDNYGNSVASAGDVNRDGYNDIIIGAPYNNGTFSGAGRAYIYFGGLNVNTIPDVTLSGNEANLYFGISVSTAGDVNGDGYADVIIGEYGYYNFTGRALIFFGGAHMNNLQDVVITGENISDILGNSVSAAGDVNGDGYSDVIIGANNYGGIGRAYICFGGSNMDGAPDLFLTGEASGDSFGTAVSQAGDVNNDGYSDVLITANSYNGNTGKAYIYFGGTNMNNTADVTFIGQNAGDNFGVSAAFAGDINGDSYSDIIIGAIGYSGNTGSAYIYFGGSNMNNIADVTLYGENSFNYFGNSVSTTGDINGDGYSDVIIGAPYNSSSKGKAYIYYGGVNMDNTSDISFSGESVNNYFGTSVASVGDMNGDGFSDVMVSAVGNNSYTGKAYLYMEGMTGTYFANLTLDGEAANNKFGTSVASAGDVNGDGFDDVIVGAANYSFSFGKAYLFFGGAHMDNIADVVFTGDAGITDYGQSVASAGDLNGDGYSDIVVGADLYNNNTGRAYVYYGGSPMNNVADLIMTGETTNNVFGCSVSSAGDVNGDGYSDLIIGAEKYNSNTGKIYLYFGGQTMNNLADLIITGESANSSFGCSVASAGDVNGDGYSDVIVGAFTYSTSTGRAYIFCGGSSMDDYINVTMTGETTNSYFGYSVSSAGDVNGDGYSDVIVGAYYRSKAYIYFGSPGMNNVADVNLTGDATDLNFGYSVSTAGDVNGDGFSDIIIGANDNLQTGRAYIYYGGLYMNNVQDILMKGEGGFNYFANSVSSAGDLNGDGNPDIIIGAPGYNSNTGRTYIYYSSSPSINPNIVSIKDVPDDQGGYVKLKWVKSGNDVPVTGSVTSYLIERSVPPGAEGYQWEQIGTVLPTQNNLYYYYTSSTPVDSGINGNSTFFYRVTAYTGATTVLYRSNIMSGNSIDNIAPSQVYAFSVNPVLNNVRLTWNRNHEPDLKNYVIYRSSSPTININTDTVFASVTDSTYLDTAPLSGVFYYFIAAQDIHNNKSPVASSGNQAIALNLTASIEGLYNPSLNNQVSDTIKVFLRNVNSPFAVVDSAKAVLNTNGISAVNFGNAPTGQYYIVITHRNALETWSKSGGETMLKGSSLNYDISDLSSKAYGNNIKQIDSSPVRFGIYSGDVNHDDYIDLTDNNLIFNSAGNFATGYVTTDLTGDNIVDLSDLTIAYNNSSNFVSVTKP